MNLPSESDATASNSAGRGAVAGRSVDAALESSLAAVESRLAALGEALLQRDLPAIDLEAGELQRSLAGAIEQFSREARHGRLSPALRRRLANTGGQLAAHRESFARATAALDRALDVLLPRERPPIYHANGARSRASIGQAIEA